MAPAGVNRLCVALWISGLILSSNLAVSLGDQALDCCLSVSNLNIPKHIVVSYREQFKGEGCSINAVLFKSRKGKILCTPSEEQWVKDLKTWLDKLWQQCQENGFKGRRCQVIKPKDI